MFFSFPSDFRTISLPFPHHARKIRNCLFPHVHTCVHTCVLRLSLILSLYLIYIYTLEEGDRRWGKEGERDGDGWGTGNFATSGHGKEMDGKW
jgi:hypothetical protein